MNLAVVEQARLWLSTPFLAGASVRGHGCDCAGLIEGIAQDLGLACPSRQAVEHDILKAARAMLTEVETPSTGTIVLLAADPDGPPLHAAIVTENNTLIHAHWSAGVVENRFGSWFQKRVTHVFGWGQAMALGSFSSPAPRGRCPEGAEGVFGSTIALSERNTPSVSFADSSPAKRGSKSLAF